MNFKKNDIVLNDLKVGVTKDIIFYPKEELKDIDNMTSSCGCSIPRIENGKIVVTYTPGSIPIHLQYLGQYKTNKTITINYKDGSSEMLSFTATIKK
jgi:hypothetical protein